MRNGSEAYLKCCDGMNSQAVLALAGLKSSGVTGQAEATISNSDIHTMVQQYHPAFYGKGLFDI